MAAENLHTHPEVIKLAKIFSSPALLGPAYSEKLVALVAHLFSPEEAAIARHLPYYRTKPLENIARKAGRDPQEIKPIIETMAARRVIYGGSNGYSLLPLIPGMFEYMLMSGVDSDWHRKYAQLLIDVLDRQDSRNLEHRRAPIIRNLPVRKAVESKTRVLGPDLVAEMIDRHPDLAVLNVCQCRQSLHFVGKECKRSAPKDGCLVFGSFARASVERGDGRTVSREEMSDIVTERQEKKLVFFAGNVGPQNPNAICTCCDCCCHFLQSVNKYGGGALLAEPPFRAAIDESLCDHCGLCVKACNTYAHTITGKVHQFNLGKCIGCGNCISGCKKGALTMVENRAYKPPAKDFRALTIKLIPAVAIAGLKAKLKNW